MDRTQSEYERIQREVDAFESATPERVADAEQQLTKDEQEKARNRRAFQHSQKMAETVRRQQYEKLHGLGYSRPDGSWVSMRDDPPPGMYGATPEPPRVAEASPQKSSQTKKPVDRWLFLVGVAVAILFFLLPKTPLVVIACCAALILLLAHPVWNFWWIERSRARQVVALLALILAAAAVGKIAWPEPTQGGGRGAPDTNATDSARIETTVSLRNLMAFYDGRTEAEADRLFAPYRGKWRRVRGEVTEVRRDGLTGGYEVELWVVRSPEDADTVYTRFGPAWNNRIEILRQSQTISAICKLDSAASSVVFMDECELK